MQATQNQIDSDKFRGLLGNYPTGVAVVTGLGSSREPLGMVVGTFTSVSLAPPLVAFLPMKSSRTFDGLRNASPRFCINILAADQEGICRTLAAPGERKFDAVDWHASPAGNPVIDGVVAWIDCEYVNIVDGGDHHIVLGAVKSMGLERDALPLLFFQRGYGRFSAEPLLAGCERQVLKSVRLAEAARDEIETVAREHTAVCSVVAGVGADSVYVAVADHSPDQRGKHRLGNRAPLAPPLGALFVDSPGAITEDQWLCRLGKNSDDVVSKAKAQLARVRRRGWSISLLGELAPEELETAIGLYSCPHKTPEQERRFFSTAAAMFDLHEPEIEGDQNYDVLHLSVPVKGVDGATKLVLRLSELPPGLSGSHVAKLVGRLQAAAAKVESLIAQIPE
ncbi:flavin reductase [Eoetvoesiella caeni]